MQSTHPFLALPLILLANLLLASAAIAEEPEGSDDALARTRHRERVFQKAEQIQRVVEHIRGLEFKHAVSMNLMGRAEFRKYLERRMAEETPEGYIENYQTAYSTLGLFPAGYDVKQGLLGMLEAGVAGLYDENEKALYIFEDVPIDGNTEMTLAHELCHALEDQYFDLGKLTKSEQFSDNEDREFALRGLIEGSATLLMYRYVAEAKLSMMELMSGQLKMAGEQLTDMTPVPMVMVRELTLPYSSGLVSSIFDAGGWAGVDALFTGDAPASSEQVLHPKKFARDFPRSFAWPDLGALVGNSWKQVWLNTLGEMRIAALTDTFAGKTETLMTAGLGRGFNRVSSGWDGDRYAVFQREGSEDTALVMLTVWDTEKDAEQFYAAYRMQGLSYKYPDATISEEEEGEFTRAFDGTKAYHVEVSGDRVIVIAGFDATLTDDVLLVLSQCQSSSDPREKE